MKTFTFFETIILLLFVITCLFVTSFPVAAGTLVWTPAEITDPSATPEGFTIYVKDTETLNEETLTVPATPTSVENAETALGMQLGKTYEISITAYNAAGESLRSDIYTHQMPEVFTPPADTAESIQEINLPKKVQSVLIKFME